MPQNKQQNQPKSSKSKKTILIIVGIVALVIGLCVLAYMWFFVGFTAKQKYTKCAKTCEEIMLLEGNIPACKARCIELYGYNPATDETTDSDTSGSEQSPEDITYYCAWTWPQRIINKDTEEGVFPCTYDRPWCDSADGTYENVGCCAEADESTGEKTDCIRLPDLLD